MIYFDAGRMANSPNITYLNNLVTHIIKYIA